MGGGREDGVGETKKWRLGQEKGRKEELKEERREEGRKDAKKDEHMVEFMGNMKYCKLYQKSTNEKKRKS
jgi:hypothetical protein